MKDFKKYLEESIRDLDLEIRGIKRDTDRYEFWDKWTAEEIVRLQNLMGRLSSKVKALEEYEKWEKKK